MPKVLRHFLEMAVSRRIFNRFPIFLLHSSWYGQYISLGFSLLKGMKSIMEKWRWNFLVLLENYIFGRKNLHHSILKSILSSNMWPVYITNQYFSRFWFFSEPHWQKVSKRWNPFLRQNRGVVYETKPYRSLMHWLEMYGFVMTEIRRKIPPIDLLKSATV